MRESSFVSFGSFNERNERIGFMHSCTSSSSFYLYSIFYSSQWLTKVLYRTKKKNNNNNKRLKDISTMYSSTTSWT